MSPRQRRAAGDRLTDAFFRSLMQVRLNCIMKDTEPRSPEGFAAAPIHRPSPLPAACGRSAWPAGVAAPRVAEARAKRGKTPVGGERQTERGARPSGRSRGPSNRSPPSGTALRAAVRTDQSSARRRQREDATRRDGVGAEGVHDLRLSVKRERRRCVGVFVGQRTNRTECRTKAQAEPVAAIALPCLPCLGQQWYNVTCGRVHVGPRLSHILGAWS